MSACTLCGKEFAAEVCPQCRGSAALARRQINQKLAKFSYPAFGGLVGMLIANFYYPMLDRNPFLVAGVGLFLLPALFHVISGIRKRLALDFDRIRSGYLYCGAVSIFVALLMVGNGAFDHSADVVVRTALVHKQAVHGKSGTSYMLRVRSWRAGRATEDLGVNARTYESVSREKGILVRMHPGRCGWPWYSGVFSE